MKILRFSLLFFLIALIGIIISCVVFSISKSKRISGDMVSQCQIISNNAIVRLYQFSGSHATTSDAYTVTYQGKDKDETKIFHSYSSPAIRSIKCEENQVVLDGYGSSYLIVLPVEWIEEELVNVPLDFYKFKLRSTEYEEEVSRWEY
jgi:hypothetical protein